MTGISNKVLYGILVIVLVILVALMWVVLNRRYNGGKNEMSPPVIEGAAEEYLGGDDGTEFSDLLQSEVMGGSCDCGEECKNCKDCNGCQECKDDGKKCCCGCEHKTGSGPKPARLAFHPTVYAHILAKKRVCDIRAAKEYYLNIKVGDQITIARSIPDTPEYRPNGVIKEIDGPKRFTTTVKKIEKFKSFDDAIKAKGDKSVAPLTVADAKETFEKYCKTPEGVEIKEAIYIEFEPYNESMSAPRLSSTRSHSRRSSRSSKSSKSSKSSRSGKKVRRHRRH